VHAAVYVRPIDTRPSPSRRGYGRVWRKIRQRVLDNYGIPREEQHRYDVDHRPPYDPEVEANHLAYDLVPMLRAEHSRKTAVERRQNV
jgi:hypothetical protein